MSNKIYYYIVEGEIEKKVIDEIKYEYIQSGKVLVKNPIQNKIPDTILRTLKINTTVILVFDTDVTTNLNILDYNISKLSKQKNIKEVILIPQVNHMEEEIVYSTNINQIKDLLGNRSNSDFKVKVLECNNLLLKLEQKKFDINKFWSKNAVNIFEKYANQSSKIKK
ncbi:MAG: hypothetical protein ACRC6A_04195 [Fusobacteriaceae bacterium]